MARYHVGRMWIERHIKQDGFPRPIKFGHTVSAVRRWRRSDIEAWEAEWQAWQGRAATGDRNGPCQRLAGRAP
jgi:predicted DNA-binding transcriptional regulator AlpA